MTSLTTELYTLSLHDALPIFDIDRVPLDDPGVYKMITAGDTTGVFQLESSGFREILKKLKPDQIEDIVAAVRSEEHTSELQSQSNLVCRLLLEKKKMLLLL